MKTFKIKQNIITNNWYIIDAKNKILGRLASELSKRLQGKHKKNYISNIDTGDYIIVINANKIIVTGKKLINKYYYHHTGYPGGIKKISFKNMLKKNPIYIIKKAVKNMLPKNSLGDKMLNKLKVFINNKHKHNCQKPNMLNI